jgi:hypothetical protein
MKIDICPSTADVFATATTLLNSTNASYLYHGQAMTEQRVGSFPANPGNRDAETKKPPPVGKREGGRNRRRTGDYEIVFTYRDTCRERRFLATSAKNSGAATSRLRLMTAPTIAA